MSFDRRYIDSTGVTYSWVAEENYRHQQRLEKGEICSACGLVVGLVTMSVAYPDICTQCEAALG